METINNEILEREFQNNYSIHEVFEYQSVSTLESVIKKINQSEKNEILLQININNMMPFYKLKSTLKNNDQEERKFWNHLISILFMTQLEEKYGVDSLHNIEVEKKLMTREPFENYSKYENIIINRNDVIESIKKMNLDGLRLHFIIRSFNDECIWKELVYYLGDKLPFVTMIYSDGNMPAWRIDSEEEKELTDLYKFKSFEGLEEGIGSDKLLTDKQYKKVLKNEAKIQKNIC